MAEFNLPQLGVNELADKIREAIGAGAWEEVRVMTPQFERTDGNDPWWTPTCAADLDAIKGAPGKFLRSLGLGLWDREGGHETWLYPHEWYDCIPDGYAVVDIFGEEDAFKRGVTDDDMRYGCLSFGFRRPEAPDA